jgi:serine/threonine-protein phosphatase 2A regulatory subunit A
MLLEWVSDPIYSIREHTMEMIKDLGFIFGAEWIEKNIFPKLLSLENEDNYLFRQIPLIAFRILAPSLNSEIYLESIFPMLSTLATDKTINIRMNVSRVILSFAPKLKGTDAEEKSVSLLNALKNDPEFDVSYYAKQALRKFK